MGPSATSSSPSSIRLVPFEAERAATVAGWAVTADEVLAWCSGTEAPVPTATVAAWGEAPDVDAFALFDGATMVAYGEVWVDDDEAEAELARIIVDPSRRGGGVGRALTQLLAAHASQRYADVFLRVRPGNDRAVRCYLGAGFVRLAVDEEQQFNVGQPVEYLWMRQADGARSSTT